MDPSWKLFQIPLKQLWRHDASRVAWPTEEVMVSLERSSRVQRIGGVPVATPETTIGTVARYSDGVTLLLTGNAVSLDHGGTVRPRAQELHEGGHAIKSLDTSRRTRYSFLQLHRNQPLQLDARFRSRCKSCPVFIVGTVGVHGIRDYYVRATIIERRNRPVDDRRVALRGIFRYACSVSESRSSFSSMVRII